MYRRSIAPIHLAALGLGLAICSGCSPSAAPDRAASSSLQQSPDAHQGEHAHHSEHDHGAHGGGRPVNYAAGVSQLEPLVRQILDACQAGDLEPAHGALHDVGTLLPILPELAADSELSKPDWEQVKKSTDRLFEIFSEIDSSMHAPTGTPTPPGSLNSRSDEVAARLKGLMDLSNKSIDRSVSE